MLVIFDLDNTLYDRSRQLPDSYTEKQIQEITAFPGVKEFLSSFPGKKVLVTHESVLGLQDKKIKVLGIGEFFDKIFICNTNEAKKKCFQEAISLFPESEMWVVGDRIDAEIRWGNELGMKTVLLAHGNYRNLNAKKETEFPHYIITRFSDFPKLLETFMKSPDK